MRYPHPDLAKGTSGRSISPLHGRALGASEGLPAAPLPLAGLSHGAARQMLAARSLSSGSSAGILLQLQESLPAASLSPAAREDFLLL